MIVGKVFKYEIFKYEVFKTKYSNTATECLAVKMIESKLGRSLFLRFDSSVICYKSFSREVCFGLAYFYL